MKWQSLNISLLNLSRRDTLTSCRSSLVVFKFDWRKFMWPSCATWEASLKVLDENSQLGSPISCAKPLPFSHCIHAPSLHFLSLEGWTCVDPILTFSGPSPDGTWLLLGGGRHWGQGTGKALQKVTYIYTWREEGQVRPQRGGKARGNKTSKAHWDLWRKKAKEVLNWYSKELNRRFLYRADLGIGNTHWMQWSEIIFPIWHSQL